MIGKRNYGLGNVLTTISDRKIPHFNTSGAFDYYQTDIISSTDYYKFGMEMPGRAFNSNTYRYGHNGQEKDQEVGDGINTAQFWEYDSRIARRWTDPYYKNTPGRTPYSYAGNTPIMCIDFKGKFKIVVNSEAQKAGVTQQTMATFDKVVANVGQLLIDNKCTLIILSKQTGLCEEVITA
ncbi:MAG: hypothetical protein WCK02_07305 [Bacteroidota bacterium]